MRGVLLVAVVSISCFASGVVVAGNPPRTRATVAQVQDILNRLAGTPLAPQQRMITENSLVETLQRKNPEPMKPWMQPSALQPVLATRNASRKRQTRTTLLAGMPNQGNPSQALAPARSTLATNTNGAIPGFGYDKGNNTIPFPIGRGQDGNEPMLFETAHPTWHHTRAR